MTPGVSGESYTLTAVDEKPTTMSAAERGPCKSTACLTFHIIFKSTAVAETIGIPLLFTVPRRSANQPHAQTYICSERISCVLKSQPLKDNLREQFGSNPTPPPVFDHPFQWGTALEALGL